MPPTPPPDLRAFATASGAAEVWAGPAGSAYLSVEDPAGEAVGLLERGEAVALALHLLRLALGPAAAEAAARAAGA